MTKKFKQVRKDVNRRNIDLEAEGSNPFTLTILSVHNSIEGMWALDFYFYSDFHVMSGRGLFKNNLPLNASLM